MKKDVFLSHFSSSCFYGFYYMNFDTHNRGSGDSTGKIFYDEKERMEVFF